MESLTYSMTYSMSILSSIHYSMNSTHSSSMEFLAITSLSYLSNILRDLKFFFYLNNLITNLIVLVARFHFIFLLFQLFIEIVYFSNQNHILYG